MNHGAHVRSVEALGELRTAIVTFEEEASAALSMAEADIARTIDWIRADRIPYWKREIMRREELLTRAKSDLARAQLTNHAMGPKSTVDERKAIARAREQVAEAQHKLKASQRWFRELEKQYTLYKGRVAAMQRVVAADLPKARSELEVMARTLDEYLAIASDGATVESPMTRSVVTETGTGGNESRRVWKDLAPSRRQRSRAALADDPEGALHAASGALRWALLDESSSRRLAHMLGVGSALEVLRFDAAHAAREFGDVAEPPPAEDKMIVAADWSPDAPTLMMRSSVAPLGDSGWLLCRSEGDGPPENLVAVRTASAIAAYPELAIALACPRGTVLMIREGELIAIHDERGRPLAAFDADRLDSSGEASEDSGTEKGTR